MKKVICSCKKPDIVINFSICFKCNYQISKDKWHELFGEIKWENELKKFSAIK